MNRCYELSDSISPSSSPGCVWWFVCSAYRFDVYPWNLLTLQSILKSARISS